jgi:hypothetical protein
MNFLPVQRFTGTIRDESDDAGAARAFFAPDADGVETPAPVGDFEASPEWEYHVMEMVARAATAHVT